jgi:hypothetical protein
MAQTDISYAPGQNLRWRRALRPGDRFPLVWSETTADQIGLARDTTTLVRWPGRRPAVYRRRMPSDPGVHVVDLAELPPAVFERLAAVLPAGPAVFLIQPDGHIADIIPDADVSDPAPMPRRPASEPAH